MLILLDVALLATVACSAALLNRARARFGRPPVKPFPAAQAGPMVPRWLGPRTIPVAQIVGSVGRWQELAADFRPRRWRWDKADDERYQRVEEALRRGLTLPPIVAYLLEGNYYVLDGHHRVAAARALGQVFLDAEVTEYRQIPVVALLGSAGTDELPPDVALSGAGGPALAA